MMDMEEDISFVIQCMQSLSPDFPIKRENLLHPTSNFVQDFYFQFLHLLEEKMAFLNGDCEQRCYPVDVEPIVSLFSRMRSFLYKTGFHYFSLNDLYEPNSKRTIVIFRISINYLVYLRSKSDQIMEEFQTYEDHKALAAENEEIKSELIKYTGEYAFADDRMQLLREEEVLCDEKYKQLKMDNQVHQQRNENLKKECQDLVEKGNSKQQVLDQELQYVADLNDQIVNDDSVEDLLKVKENTEAQLAALKMEQNQTEENFDYKSQDMQQFERVQKKLESFDIKVITSFLTNTHHEIEESEREYKHRLQALDFLDKQALKFNETIKNLQELIASRRLKQAACIEGLKSELGNVNEQIALKIDSQEKSNKQKGILYRKRTELQMQKDSLMEDVEKIKNCFAENYTKILRTESAVTNAVHKLLTDTTISIQP